MSASIRVLVVDDEEEIRLNTAAFLAYFDFDVISASSGEQAMQILADERVDVGIIDMRMPGMDGNTVILNAHRLQPEMKFLILTGSINYLMPEALKRMGMTDDHLFKKPLLDMKVLVRAINRFVSPREMDADE